MNKNRLLQGWHTGCTLLAALFMAACSQEELDDTQGEPLPAGQYPLELTASGLEVVATPAQASTRGTFEGNWDGVDYVNIMVANEMKRYKVTPQQDNTASLIGSDVDNIFYWTSMGERKNVMVWAPTHIGYKTEFILPEEWTEDEFAYRDIIGAAKPISYNDENKHLEFQHLLAKVVVNLKQSPYLEKATGKNINVKLIDIFRKGKLVTNENGELTIDEPQSYVDMKLCFLPDKDRYENVEVWGNAKPFASYTVLVLPEKIFYNEDERILQIEVDGIAYNLTPRNMENYYPGEYLVSYEAGRVTTFNVTVSEKGLDVSQQQHGLGTRRCHRQYDHTINNRSKETI